MSVNSIVAQLLAEAGITRFSSTVRPGSKPPKTTRTFPKGARLSYRFWPAGKDGMGRAVRFCYSVQRNEAGFFLSWKEVIGKKVSKRSMFAGRRVRAKARELAKARRDRFVAKREKVT